MIIQGYFFLMKLIYSFRINHEKRKIKSQRTINEALIKRREYLEKRLQEK